MSTNKFSSRNIFIVFYSFCIAFFAVSGAYLAGAAIDYPVYMEQWQAVIDGFSPWSLLTNTYGPIHSALALFYAIDPMLPRVLFTLMWLALSFWLVWSASKNPDIPENVKWILAAAVLGSPLFWVFVVRFGVNDMLSAFFVLVGITLYRARKDGLSGLSMAIAVGVKFIPIVMLPFLILSGKKIRWRFAISVAAGLAFIFGVSYWLWGSDIFYPFQFGVERPSALLSIFRFLRSNMSPLRWVNPDVDLDWMSTYAVIIALVGFFFIYLKNNLDSILSSIVGVLLLLTFYKVGHHQFYLIPVLLLVNWIIVDYKKLDALGFDFVPVINFGLWLGFVSLLFLMYPLYWGMVGWHALLGFLHFLCCCWLIWRLVRFAFVEKMGADNY
jgi:hypothetical protein